jgi:hypothetical protein
VGGLKARNRWFQSYHNQASSKFSGAFWALLAKARVLGIHYFLNIDPRVFCFF